ncbi:hypothetical protein C8J56DRAFT_1074419 [Mycena floridula]|nr:hypothetical protein C8J56DRAFT_1074419 [Mycena floridula]
MASIYLSSQTVELGVSARLGIPIHKPASTNLFTFGDSAKPVDNASSDSESDDDSDSDSDSDDEPMVIYDEPHVQYGGFCYPKGQHDSRCAFACQRASPAPAPCPAKKFALARSPSPVCRPVVARVIRKNIPKPILPISDDEAGYDSGNDASETNTFLQLHHPALLALPILLKVKQQLQRVQPSVFVSLLHLATNRFQTAEILRLASKKTDREYICPVPRCPYAQTATTKLRYPDYKRHLNSHIRSNTWWCKGVLVEDRHLWRSLPADAKEYTFGDDKQLRVGGCCQSFSRRDALKRHLDNGARGCIGQALRACDEPIYD